jgi:hypothetical protein
MSDSVAAYASWLRRVDFRGGGGNRVARVAAPGRIRHRQPASDDDAAGHDDAVGH